MYAFDDERLCLSVSHVALSITLHDAPRVNNYGSHGHTSYLRLTSPDGFLSLSIVKAYSSPLPHTLYALSFVVLFGFAFPAPLCLTSYRIMSTSSTLLADFITSRAHQITCKVARLVASVTFAIMIRLRSTFMSPSDVPSFPFHFRLPSTAFTSSLSSFWRS